MNSFQEPIQLFIAIFLNNCFFSKNQNELPLVVVLLQEKTAILSKKIFISIWAKKLQIKNVNL